MARWLANELTEAERMEFEASSEYAEYQRLVNGLDAFEKPAFDKEALRERVWRGIEDQGSTKVIRLKPLYYALGIAASFLVIVGLFFNTVTYTAATGEKLNVVLPDGTQVALNAESTLTHNRFFWMDNKAVDLKGEGYFSVTKGKGFVVNTPSGSVNVLGTEFNVKTREGLFALYCYEGKVRYENSAEQQEAYLNAGDAVELEGNILLEFKHSDAEPPWKLGRSRFSNAELGEVINELEIQFGVSLVYQPTLIKGHFTGSFVHDDLALALKSVFVPMGITYDISEDQKTITLSAQQ